MQEDNEKLSSYFTTGEFAKLCKVKKQTLFHYDNIGVFSPEIKKENGYRYYSYSQLEVFYVISMLKGLNMPLKKIKSHLDNRSPENLVVMLEEQIRCIDRKLEDLNSLKNTLRIKVRLTLDALRINTETVQIEELPEDEPLISTPCLNADDEKKIAVTIAHHLNYCHDLNIYSAYTIGGRVLTSQVPIDKNYNYSHFYTRLQQSEAHAANDRKRKGKYAVVYHIGGFDTACNAYLKLVEYAKTHGFDMGQHFYEDIMLDELSMRGYDNYVLKISVRCSGPNAEKLK